MKRSFMFHSSKRTSFPVTLAQEKNRRSSARSATGNGPVRRLKQRLPFSITPAKCLRFRPRDKCTPVTHSPRTQSGRGNLRIRFLFGKRQTQLKRASTPRSTLRDGNHGTERS